MFLRWLVEEFYERKDRQNLVATKHGDEVYVHYTPFLRFVMPIIVLAIIIALMKLTDHYFDLGFFRHILSIFYFLFYLFMVLPYSFFLVKTDTRKRCIFLRKMFLMDKYPLGGPISIQINQYGVTTNVKIRYNRKDVCSLNGEAKDLQPFVLWLKHYRSQSDR